jgi:vitamin B12 transporter
MKTRVRTVRLLLIAALLSASVASAEDLTGKVLDPDGAAVPNSSLRLFDRNTGEMRTTRTTSDGSYSFQGIPAGDYLLEGDAANAALSGSRQITVTGTKSENLSLKVSGRSTEILVTASSVPLSAEETGKAIDVVSAEDLALRNEFSLGEALRVLPGVRVQSLEGPGSFTKIITRGLRAQDTAVLIDGMRFHDAGAPQNDASGFIGDMTLVDTDRIEFLRGSGSSLYGSNALGGVINLTSRSGGGPTHGSLRVEGGGLGMIRGVGNMSGGFFSDRFTYSGAAGHLYTTTGVRDGLPYRNNSLQGTGKFSFAPGISLAGRTWFSSNYLTATESPTVNAAVRGNSSATGEVPAIPLPMEELKKFEAKQSFNAGNATYIPNQIDPDGRRKGTFFNGVLLFQHQVSANTSYRAAYQAVDTRRTYTDGPLGPGTFEPGPNSRGNFNGYIDTFQARLDQRAGQYNLITVGYEGEQEQYFSYDGNDSDATAASRIDLRQRSHAFYVQDQISLMNRRLQLTVAGRAQFFDLQAPEFQGFTNPYSSTGTIEAPTAYTGDGAIAYFVQRSRTKLRGHVGNSFRSPSGYERFGGGFGSYFGDPRLAPERAVSVDGGIDQWLFNSKLELTSTFFYTNIQQIIRFANSFAPGTDPFGRTFGGYANGGGGIARGLEFGAKVSPTLNTKIQATYTYVNSDSRAPSISGTQYYKVLSLSPHVMTVTLTQWIARRTNVTFDMATHSDYTKSISGGGQRQFRFNGPTKADVMVRHDIPFGDDHKLEVYGKLENMFNQRAYEDGFIGPKAWFITGMRLEY